MKYIRVYCAALWFAISLAEVPRADESNDILPETARLEWPELDLSGRLMDGAHKFVERKIAESVSTRATSWNRDFSSQDAYERSIEPNRERLRTIIGVVDNRMAPNMERYGDDANPALIVETSKYQVYQVRWHVLDGLWGTGLLVQPKSTAVAHVVVVPDADQTPEQLLGLAPGIPPTSQIARRLAENAIEVIVPVTISRDKLPTNDKQLLESDQTYREWIYRQAFHMGRHPIGYEVQTVLGAVDWFREKYGAESKIGVCGYAEGGHAAFLAAAIDARINVSFVSGYFDDRQNVWSEPIYRNVWSRLREFGDAEIASIIMPRDLLIEHSSVPDVTGHKGEFHTPDFASLSAEVQRIPIAPLIKPPVFVHGENGKPVVPYSDKALKIFANMLGIQSLNAISKVTPIDVRKSFDPATRHARLFHEMEQHVQGLIQKSDHARDQRFLYAIMPELADWRWSTNPQHPTRDPVKFAEGAKAFREKFRDEGMGRFDEPFLPFNPRTRKIAETDKWIAYDVVLDVWPEVFAWGILVIPKDLKPGERRPVVVCQHGRDGVPRKLLDGNETGYNNVAARLAERGFITFAPHNLYRFEDRYRWLSRKANTVKATLFSFIIAQHDQILRWLSEQPFVDGDRIAFYGLSYGGETAVRVPPLLEKYCLSICSGDFNQWTRKVASTDQPFSFMRTIEWEMPYWNLGQTFDYSEMASLMIPRPFMVERGHLDLVGRDQWVSYEYGKVRWLYAQLGLSDRTEIEFFQGGHSMYSHGTFDFLHKHLNWPKPQTESK